MMFGHLFGGNKDIPRADQFRNTHPEKFVVRIWETKCIPKIKSLVGCSLLTELIPEAC
jgi:hypothetical protein